MDDPRMGTMNRRDKAMQPFGNKGEKEQRELHLQLQCVWDLFKIGKSKQM